MWMSCFRAHRQRVAFIAGLGALVGGSSICRTERSPQVPKLVIFSGGSAFNGIAEPLSAVFPSCAHVLPVSDDGGSTAEIVRVIGGPAIGDIRSRCLRLSDTSTAEARAVRALLGHRLPHSAAAAKEEWGAIVDGSSPLWQGVSTPFKDTIRAFLVHFYQEVLRSGEARRGEAHFSFSNGSVGNFFFAGARVFFHSLDAALFLYARVSRIPPDACVLPAIQVQSDERVTLGAELADGRKLLGQSEISHPAAGSSIVDKEGAGLLPSPVARVFYVSSEPSRHEVTKRAHPAVLEKIAAADAVVFGMGSLWTSICPSLLVAGVSECLAALPKEAPRILLLNGSHDRETDGMDASDVVRAVASTLNEGRTDGQRLEASAYVNTLFVPAGGSFAVDAVELHTLGVRLVVEVESEFDGRGRAQYQPDALVEALQVYTHRTRGYREVKSLRWRESSGVDRPMLAIEERGGPR